MKYYLQKIDDPKVRLEILGRDKATNQMKIRGANGRPFSREITKEVLATIGMKVVKEES